MKVVQLTVNPFAMNCYIYYDEVSGDGVIFDPAVFTEEEKNYLKKFIEENKIKIRYIINTHGHIDHIMGNRFAKDLFKVPVLMHKDDLFLTDNAKRQAAMYSIDFPEPPPVDEFISEDSKINIGNSALRFIHTPGHSPGSVCIIDDANKNVFCGDLIFKDSIGRTDFEGGNLETLLDSIRNNLFKNCADDYVLFPGHMEITNVGDEKRFNPFLNS